MAAAITASIVRHQAVFGIDQRHLDRTGALQAGTDRVHPEHRRGEQHAIAAGFAQCAHQQVDGLVTAAANQHLRRLRAI
jgi:hypothetical protein